MNELMQFFSQDLFTKIVGSAGVLAAVASMVSTILGFAVHSWAATRKLRAAEEDKFKRALETDDLIVLGDYLSSTVGQFTVHEYATRQEVAYRVDRMLARLIGFVGAEGEVQTAQRTEPPQRERTEPPVPPELANVAIELETGEIWNGLARLRRAIEIRLRRYGLALGFKERHLRSAGQALRILADRGHIPPETARLLDYAIRVSNEGIHGNVVPLEQAQEAFHAAIDGLRQVGLIQEGSN